MKYIVVLGDGMSGVKLNVLGNKTCLESAVTPTLDRLAPLSEIGLCRTVPKGLKPGSDVANMSVLGFDPNIYYTGRSPLEALSIGVRLCESEATLRCNLVTLSGEGEYENKTMLDYSAGEISTVEANILIESLKEELIPAIFDLYCGISYRHCLVEHGGKSDCNFTPPHDISDQKIAPYLPSGAGSGIFSELQRKSYEILSKHPVNLARVKAGKNPANSIWFWGEGTKPALPSFESVHGLKGGIITAVDLVKGLGKAANMQIIEVDGATGNFDTNFSGKAEAAVDALLGGLDFIYIHMEAPDECGHHGDYKHKIFSIEQISEKVVKTIISRLDGAGEEFAMLVCPDHPTPCTIKTHASDPVPYLLYGSVKNLGNGAARYTEDEAERTKAFVYEGHTLIKKLFSIKN